MARFGGGPYGSRRPLDLGADQSYDALMRDATANYLATGGTQANVDAYRAANPGQDYNRLFGDAASRYMGTPGYAGDVGNYFGANNPAGGGRNTMIPGPGGGYETGIGGDQMQQQIGDLRGGLQKLLERGRGVQYRPGGGPGTGPYMPPISRGGGLGAGGEPMVSATPGGSIGTGGGMVGATPGGSIGTGPRTGGLEGLLSRAPRAAPRARSRTAAEEYFG